jgi:hypothetical protein
LQPSSGAPQNGFDTDWYVINAATGFQLSGGAGLIPITSGAVRPHNTICDTNGSGSTGQIYFGAVDVSGGASGNHSVAVYNIAGGTQTTVGNFTAGTGRVRPFTVDKMNGLIYVTLEDFVGFSVGNVSTGAVVFDGVSPTGTYGGPGYTQPMTSNVVNSHAIALSADGNKLFVGDPNMASAACVASQGSGSSTSNGIEVWDVSAVRAGGAPVYRSFLHTAQDCHDYDGKTPGWAMTSYDGRYLIAETGEVWDVSGASPVSVTRLLDPNQTDGNGGYMDTRYGIEVDFNGATPVRAGEQFGTGHTVIPIP